MVTLSLCHSIGNFIKLTRSFTKKFVILVCRYIRYYCGYRQTFRPTDLTDGAISASLSGFNLLAKVIFYKSTIFLTNQNTSRRRLCGSHYKAQKCLTFEPRTIFSDRKVKDGLNWIVSKNFTLRKKNTWPPQVQQGVHKTIKHFSASVFQLREIGGLWMHLESFSVLYSRRYAKQEVNILFLHITAALLMTTDDTGIQNPST